jgi:kynurenine formamidase
MSAPRVARSPWGDADEIGRLNWITPESIRTVLGTLGSGQDIVDLSVDLFVGMPSWSAAGDPTFQIWMTHTPAGTVAEDRWPVSRETRERFSYSGDAILMYTHCGTHLDTLNHRGYYGECWNGWNAREHMGSRHWLRCGPENYPPIVARAVLLDVAGLHGVDCLPSGYAITADDLRAAAREQGVRTERGQIVHVRTGRMTRWPDPDAYMVASPGLGLEAARHLCEDVGAMCVGSDSIALEVLPHEGEDAWMPVHSYLLGEAGAQIMEVLDLERLAAERRYEFVFIGLPLKIRGATGAPMRAIAVPIST